MFLFPAEIGQNLISKSLYFCNFDANEYHLFCKNQAYENSMLQNKVKSHFEIGNQLLKGLQLSLGHNRDTHTKKYNYAYGQKKKKNPNTVC